MDPLPLHVCIDNTNGNKTLSEHLHVAQVRFTIQFSVLLNVLPLT